MIRKYNLRNTIRKIQIENTHRKIQSGKYRSEIPVGNIHLGTYTSEITHGKIQIGRIYLGKYKSENTIGKYNSQNQNRKNSRTNTIRCNSRHCNIAIPYTGVRGIRRISRIDLPRSVAKDSQSMCGPTCDPRPKNKICVKSLRGERGFWRNGSSEKQEQFWGAGIQIEKYSYEHIIRKYERKIQICKIHIGEDGSENTIRRIQKTK